MSSSNNVSVEANMTLVGRDALPACLNELCEGSIVYRVAERCVHLFQDEMWVLAEWQDVRKAGMKWNGEKGEESTDDTFYWDNYEEYLIRVSAKGKIVTVTEHVYSRLPYVCAGYINGSASGTV